MSQQLIHTFLLLKWLKDIFIKLSKPEMGFKHCVLAKVKHCIENDPKSIKNRFYIVVDLNKL